MKKIKQWVIGLGAAITALFGVHHFQPTQIETNPSGIVTPTPFLKATPTPVSNFNDAPRMELGTIIGTESEKTMIRSGLEIDNNILASSCFNVGVLTSNFTETNGLNNQQIYNAFKAHIIKINVTMFSGTWYQNHISKTVGYELDNDPNTCYQNRYYIDNAYDSGSNMLHEAAHGIGFHHYGVKATSIPYQMNDIYDKCAEELGIVK